MQDRNIQRLTTQRIMHYSNVRYVSEYVYVYVYACVRVCMYVCAYVCIRMYVRRYVCTFVCMYVCMYVFICIYVQVYECRPQTRSINMYIPECSPILCLCIYVCTHIGLTYLCMHVCV
jgi:nuclear pore complex protein Nup62